VHCWVVHRKANTVHWVSSSIYYWCSSYMFRHVRAILRERLCPCECVKCRQLSMVSDSVTLCALCAGLSCCALLCFPTEFENTKQHSNSHRQTVHTRSRYQRPYLAAYILHTHKDKDAPWGWHVGAETCRSCINNKYLTKSSAQCWFFYAQPSNARYKHQITSRLLLR
jgi:hypothetical protein